MPRDLNEVFGLDSEGRAMADPDRFVIQPQLVVSEQEERRLMRIWYIERFLTKIALMGQFL